MRSKEKDAAEMAVKRQRMLEEGFRLFSEKSIDMVSMPDVAKACGYGIATLYRYFNTKLALVIAVGTWAWDNYIQDSILRLSKNLPENMTAAQILESFLDFYIDLYRNHADLLRFNQFFNIFVMGEGATDEQLKPYTDMIRKAADGFHVMYIRAKKDGTVRTDISETEMFYTSIHIMLAATTRYAVGLVYTPDSGKSSEDELVLLKKMLLREYVINDN